MKHVGEGIFIFRTVYSDTSLIVTFYTKNQGLKKFIFKGGKKKAHNLFPLAISELTYYERKETDLSLLNAADPVQVFNFPFDPVRSTIAYFVAEVIRKAVSDTEKDEHLYTYLIDVIHEIETSNDLVFLPHRFLLGFADKLGIHPQVEGNADIIDFAQGTIGHVGMSSNDIEQGDHIDLIRELIQNGHTKSADKTTRMKALNTLLRYMNYHIPRMDSTNTLEIVKEILS